MYYEVVHDSSITKRLSGIANEFIGLLYEFYKRSEACFDKHCPSVQLKIDFQALKHHFFAQQPFPDISLLCLPSYEYFPGSLKSLNKKL